MYTRTLEKFLPACRAKTDLLRSIENYIRQKAADLTGTDGTYGVSFLVTIQDSWGSRETSSIEDVPTPLNGDVSRIRFELVCYEKVEDSFQTGREYFTVSLTFAVNPALSICHMRLTGETADLFVLGMWGEIEQKIKAVPMKGFVQRFISAWLICFLVAGLLLSIITALLFAYQQITVASIFLVATLFILTYTFFSWRLPHCVFDTADNEHRLDINKWFWRAIVTSVIFAVVLRLVLKFGFNL